MVKWLHGDRIAFESLAVYFKEGKGIKGGSSSAVDWNPPHQFCVFVLYIATAATHTSCTVQTQPLEPFGLIKRERFFWHKNGVGCFFFTLAAAVVKIGQTF